ncbi:DUF4129 domain-containing protein [Mesobacillus foraminis]|uniref:DUF4129 domain-containing transglutaminase family protein n=1 Tax=Mesobacillus foraminis TaxID=279826 RepID=UPI001BEB0B49|nr:transglutaminase domain-containing protein [Mesobacillus foraminis]MBT2758110.1 DUF4129 domain-containing protein [Mesobacillus foraminis]
MKAHLNRFDFGLLLLYCLSFLLIWEWLRPVKELTETGNIGVFIVFVFIALLLSLLGVRAFAGFCIKILYILYSVHSLYYQGSLLNFSWAGSFIKDLKANFGRIWNAQWTELDDVFRTLLFFTLLWIIAYLIQYWLITRKRIFVFFLMTLIFITVLDTFTPYDAYAAIIRTAMAGFLVMGMLTFYRLVEMENIKKSFIYTRKWMVPLAVMIALSSALGYAAPKAEPIWPDPVPFIKSFNSESGEGQAGIKRAGYGTDDSRLGGAFLGDDQVVFTTEIEEQHYWKVETKGIYTGKGWVADDERANTLDFSEGTVPPMLSFYDTVPSKKRTSTVRNVLDYSHIQYPHGVMNIETDDFYLYRLNQVTQKISSLKEFEDSAPDSYTVQYRSPSFQVKELQNSSAEEDENLSESILADYTQLPSNLPPTVKELALEVTEGKESWFDKAQAVEEYFRMNGFVYDQINAAMPGEDEDYVAQFLFETKRGYCDNFSTAMAVMLRTLDIPTRWVKGYTEGEYKETLKSGKMVYEVTNNNAHSWVEVYFPGVGWVPFEPTQGFSDNVTFEYEVESETSEETEEEQQVAAEAPVKPEVETPVEAAGTTTSESMASWFQNLKNLLSLNMKNVIISGVLFWGILAIIFLTRKKWLPFYYVTLFKMRHKEEHFPEAYRVLLMQLQRHGLKRGKDQTLREYAKYVDQFFSSRDMGQLTVQYEQFLYRGELKEGTWAEARPHWESLIKKAG